MRKAISAIIILAIFSTGFAKSYVYEAINVYSSITPEGNLHVVEEQIITFSGSYTYVYRNFYSGVKDFKISGNVNSFKENDNTYTWYGTWSDTTERFVLEYTIIDPFNVKPENDTLFETLIFSDRSVIVKSSTCFVSLPKDVLFAEDRVNVRVSTGSIYWINNSLIKITASNIPANVPLDFEITLPKGTISPQNSLKNLVSMNESLFIILLIIPVIILFLTIHYFTVRNYYRLKKLKIINESESINEPVRVEDIRPAIAGFINDLRAGPNEVIATIIDLAVRGYIYVHKVIKQNWFDQTFLVKVKNNYTQLNSYEERIMHLLFKKKDKIELNELRECFKPEISSTELPIEKIYELIRTEANKTGLFTKDFDEARNNIVLKTVVPSIIYFGSAFIYNFIAIAILSNIFDGIYISVWFTLFIINLVILSVMIGLVNSLITLTGKGEGARNTYKELRLFITNAPLTEGRLFDEYLPYAIALGVQKEWIKKGSMLNYNSNWHDSNFNTGGIIMITSSLNNSLVYASSRGGSGGGGGFGGGGGAGGGGGGAG